MRRALPFLSLFFVVVLAGCSEKPVVNLHRRVKNYKSIISLSPSVTELILSNADMNALKGRTKSCNYPLAMTSKIPIVASVKPDFEAIQKLSPDLIVYDSTLYSKDEIDKIKSTTGADVFALDSNTVDGFIDKLQDMGSLLASEMRFNDYVNRIIGEQGAASGGKFTPVPKVAVMMPGENGTGYIAGSESFLADVVKTGGGQPVGPKGTQFVTINAESLVALNPDVIIVNGTKEDHAGYDALLRDPRFTTINALKEHRVGVVETDVLLRKGQRVDQLIKAVHRLMAPPSK